MGRRVRAAQRHNSDRQPHFVTAHAAGCNSAVAGGSAAAAAAGGHAQPASGGHAQLARGSTPGRGACAATCALPPGSRPPCRQAASAGPRWRPPVPGSGHVLCVMCAAQHVHRSLPQASCCHAGAGTPCYPTQTQTYKGPTLLPQPPPSNRPAGARRRAAHHDAGLLLSVLGDRLLRQLQKGAQRLCRRRRVVGIRAQARLELVKLVELRAAEGGIGRHAHSQQRRRGCGLALQRHGSQ